MLFLSIISFLHIKNIQMTVSRKVTMYQIVLRRKLKRNYPYIDLIKKGQPMHDVIARFGKG